VPLPGAVAGIGLKLADAVGIDLPVGESQLTMLAEGNVIPPNGSNALVAPLGVTPTSLDDGLRLLLDALPEQLPDEGVGPLHRKRFWADIVGATVDAPTLFARFRTRFQELTPDHMDLDAEPETPSAVLERGQTVTMALPLRGNVQVRVAELGLTGLTLQTVQGHPLAGAVRFTLEPPSNGSPDVLRFQVEVFDRAANVVDWLAMATVGDRLQSASWREIVENVVAESGGTAADGVQTDEAKLDDDAAKPVEKWLADLALRREREDNREG
jgi:NADH dehydrogenase